MVTEEENSILQNFKTAVADLNQDDETLLRFLRARDLDLIKAEAMLRKNIAWRINNQIESITNWSRPEIMQNGCTYKFTGVDNDGCPEMKYLLALAISFILTTYCFYF